jgi:hypothetical protein
MPGLIDRRPVIIPTSSADTRGRVSGWMSNLTNEKAIRGPKSESHTRSSGTFEVAPLRPGDDEDDGVEGG